MILRLAWMAWKLCPKMNGGLEEPYLLELVRYIHLNPVRSRLPVTTETLDRYPWTGHAVLLGYRPFPAQDTDFVLSQFGRTTKPARLAYRQFVIDGTHVPQGRLGLCSGILPRCRGLNGSHVGFPRGTLDSRDRWVREALTCMCMHHRLASCEPRSR
jgi:hypothetical protein